MKSSHINEQGFPLMVDISQKGESLRRARARAMVSMPLHESMAGMIPAAGVNPDGAAAQASQASPGGHDAASREWMSPKGPVFQTAIIAGIQAAKKTPSLIPLCHSLGLTACDISIEAAPADQPGRIEFRILCTATTFGRTGVEMEALTGASVAALTLYDMAKSVVRDIEIRNIILESKTGGTHDF